MSFWTGFWADIIGWVKAGLYFVVLSIGTIGLLYIILYIFGLILGKNLV